MNSKRSGNFSEYERTRQLDRYLPESVRMLIEGEYYAKVSEQAQLDLLQKNKAFMTDPFNHVGLYSDHGIVHVRDVAMNILQVLDAIHGVLIHTRSLGRFSFMQGAGVMLAYMHDVGMRNFSAIGRAMHPEFAAQEVFTPEFDEIIATIWGENYGNIAWRLVNLKDSGSLAADPKLVLREILALSLGHSKSKIPIEVLNNPEDLRARMVRSVGSDLLQLYHQQQVAKADAKFDQAKATGGDTEKRQETEHTLEQARAAQKEFQESAQGTIQFNETARRLYADFDNEAFTWITSEYSETQEMLADLIDVLRALRVADALRQRGTTLKTSAGYQILVDQNTANAVISLQKGSGEIFLLESDNPLSAGEANMASSELTPSGDLRVSFSRGAFSNRETTRRGAFNVAAVIDDIQRDTIETFQLPDGIGEGLKSNQEIQILIEETDDNLEFADLVLEELLARNSELKDKSRIVPSLKNVAPEERERYLQAEELDWSAESAHREKTLVRIAQSGHQTELIDPQAAFTDVRICVLREGETLMNAGAPPGFVYIPMGEGLFSTPLGGYQAFAVKPWIPLGNTRVIRGAAQEATVTAQAEVSVLTIPKEIYLKFWHDTYDVEEFKEYLPKFYAEDRLKGYEQIIEILRQVAMIDAHLDQAEIEFIQKFADTWDMAFDAAQMRVDMEGAGRTDYVSLRQSVTDYLSVAPPFSQVIELRDLLNTFVQSDEQVSDEETLILSELMGLFASYLDEQDLVQYRVLIVPQSNQQDQAITSLFPEFTKGVFAGGVAYLVGTFYSKDYAQMIADRYRALHFFSTVEESDLETAPVEAIEFSEEEQALHQNIFQAFTPIEFKELVKMGHWHSVPAEVVLVSEGEMFDKIIYIHDGDAEVITKRKRVNTIGDGSFVGEMGFITNEPAIATVRTTSPMRYLYWSRNELEELLAQNPSMYAALQTIFSVDLVKKMQAQAPKGE